MRNTDSDWETFAQRDPYWAVLTHDDYHAEKLDADAREAFFSNGEGTIQDAMDTLREHFPVPDRFDVALDFGCGVGRLLLPLARRSRIAVGVDVSPSMLAECGNNAYRFGFGNVILRQSDDTLSRIQEFAGEVNFLNSLLVLQHIPPSRGIELFGRLLDLLRPVCYGTLQVVAGSTPVEFGDHAEPVMEMNPYDLNVMFSMMHARGIREVFCRMENHDGLINVNLYFHRGSR